jgi:hypothetical protein
MIIDKTAYSCEGLSPGGASAVSQFICLDASLALPIYQNPTRLTGCWRMILDHQVGHEQATAIFLNIAIVFVYSFELPSGKVILCL